MGQYGKQAIISLLMGLSLGSENYNLEQLF